MTRTDRIHFDASSRRRLRRVATCLSILMIMSGGLAIFGGVVGGVMSGYTAVEAGKSPLTAFTSAVFLVGLGAALCCLGIWIDLATDGLLTLVNRAEAVEPVGEAIGLEEHEPEARSAERD